MLAAILQQPKAHAAQPARSPGHHAARRPRVHLARHHEDAAGRTTPAGPATARGRHRRRGAGDVARPARGLLPEPHRPRAQGPARSADRPDGGAAAHDRSALPPAQEQPRVRRRGRRRQDGDGRRPRHAAARRRRPRHAEGRGGLLARHRRAARRHALPRRLRGALQGGHQGAERTAARHPLHRRDPLHRRRRRDDRRHDGPGDADQADPHRRRSARHRLDDVRGVQAHREGPRAGAAAAEDRDRRAVDRGDGADPERPARALRRASPRDATPTPRSKPPPSWRRATCATTGCPTAPST